jgi:hypothetical protein
MPERCQSSEQILEFFRRDPNYFLSRLVTMDETLLYHYHRALATQKKVAYLGFQYLDHPPYSPDLAPSDYHLFRGLKKQFKGCHFSSDAKVIAATQTWLNG